MENPYCSCKLTRPGHPDAGGHLADGDDLRLDLRHRQEQQALPDQQVRAAEPRPYSCSRNSPPQGVQLQ